MSAKFHADLDLMQKLKTGEAVAKSHSAKSIVWKTFYLVHESSSNVYTGYVQCQQCKTLFKHDKAKSGTTHLNLHLKRCKMAEKSDGQGTSGIQTKMSSFCGKTSPLPGSAKFKVVDACVEFVAADLRPFKSVEGQSFAKLAQTCFELGAKYGNTCGKLPIPSRHTIKRKVEESACKVKEDLAEELLLAIKSNGIVGITTDMWSDLKQRHYISLTGHYFIKQKLQSRILTVCKFPDHQKTGVNIRDTITKLCATFNLSLDKVMLNCCFVTDQGSNVKSALANFRRQPCACHMLATVVKHTLQLDSFSKTVLPMSNDDTAMKHVNDIRSNVSGVKSLVSFFKKSGLCNNLSSGLQQSCETRWNFTCTMIMSFLKLHTEIRDTLSAKNLLQKIEDIDVTVLQVLVEFLAPFHAATKALEGDLKPTIHHVFQWKTKLERGMHILTTDCSLTKFLKIRGRQVLNEKFEITTLQQVGLFLNPKFKSLLPLVPNQRNEVMEYCYDLMKSFFGEPEMHTIDSSDYAYGPPAKKSCMDCIDDEFAEWQHANDVSFENDNEIKQYANAVFASELTNAFVGDDGKFNIVEFWCSAPITTRFASLSKLALGILSIPASSSSSERAFSVGGNFLRKKRAQLSASSVDSLVVLNSFYKADS